MADAKINKTYLYFVVLTMLVLPVLSIVINSLVSAPEIWLELVGKWFVFWSIGVRLLVAGLKQVKQPAFTAKDIFHIDDPKSHVLVRELGFANICSGTAGVMSLFMLEWRIAVAFIGGLFLGFAGITHVARKHDSANELIPTISNLFIFAIMIVYVSGHILRQ